MSIDYKQTRTVAASIVDQARERLLAIPRSDLQAVKKADNSFVTRADRDTEAFIREQLQMHFPDHSILGEEFPSVDKDSPFQWVIDPIDGTHSFKHGVPLYGIMLCLLEEGQPVVGIVDLAGIGRSYAAAKGAGTLLNGQPVLLPDLDEADMLADEIIAIGERRAFIKGGRPEVFDTLLQAHNHLRTYCDCFGHMLAAEGSVGAMIDFNIRIWDCMASVVIVEEAGGKALCVGKRGEDNLYRYDWVMGKPAVVDWVCEQLDLKQESAYEVKASV